MCLCQLGYEGIKKQVVGDAERLSRGFRKRKDKRQAIRLLGCDGLDSNQRPPAYETGEMTTSLPRICVLFLDESFYFFYCIFILIFSDKN